MTRSGPFRREGLRRWRCLGRLAGWVAVLLFCCDADPLVAAAETDDSAAAVRSPIVFGIEGHYRVGRMTSIRFNEVDESLRDQYQLETLDGDGVRVRHDAFRYPKDRVPENGEIGYVVPGSEGAPLVLLHPSGGEDSDGDVVVDVDTRFPISGVPARGPAMIPIDQPWVVVLGDPLGIDEIGASQLLEKQSRIAVTRVESASGLPHRHWGYDGVDLVCINRSGLPVLKAMQPSQIESLMNWVKQGGDLFVCMGASTDDYQQVAPWLFEPIPFEADVSTVRLDPAALETYMSSQTPLRDFDGVKLPRRKGDILVSGRTKNRITAVIAADYLFGFGKMTVIAADLDDAVFAQWPERLGVVTQLVGSVLDNESDQDVSRDRSISFDDLAGQMRATLDQFPVKAKFDFSVISVILILLIALLGPLDYFLINRLFGRPLLGWLSFPLVAIGLSVILVMQSQPRSGTTGGDIEAGDVLLRSNQFQVFDFDQLSGRARGFSWQYLYSHGPSESHLHAEPSAALESLVSGSTYENVVFAMGFPGSAFGGVQMVGENSVLPRYAIAHSSTDGPEELSTDFSVRRLTLAPRSSRSIASRVCFSTPVDQEMEVVRRPGSELLRGSLENPLPFDLLDGMLIYRNLVYLLPTRFQAGTQIPSVGDLRQKNFRWLLTRQESLEKNVTENIPWTASDFSDAPRVSEMLLFHAAAGGELYTRLKHQPLSHLDLSHLLSDDRCILVGRTEQPLMDWTVGVSDGGDPVTPEGSVHSVVRVVLPVRETRLDP